MAKLPLLALCVLLAISAPRLAAAIEALPAEVSARDNAALQAALKKKTAATGCGTSPLVIVYGSTPPSSLAPLVEDQPPLPRLPPLGSSADVELHSATDGSSSCLSGVKRIRGTLLILDDGSLGPSPF